MDLLSLKYAKNTFVFQSVRNGCSIDPSSCKTVDFSFNGKCVDLLSLTNINLDSSSNSHIRGNTAF